MPEISHSTKKLIQQYQLWQKSLQPKEGMATICVDEVASKVAAFYEKIRGVIDWQEEHLLRKKAIKRNLERRLFFNISDENNIAGSLVLELIRGGHFSNGAIPETKIDEVQKMIDKYVYILNNATAPTQKEKKGKSYKQIKLPPLEGWILGIAACELEDILSPPIKETALINYMTEMLVQRIKIIEGVFVVGGLKKEKINTQIYIAVQKALFRLDSDIISYHLLKLKYPEWLTPQESLLKKTAENIYNIQEEIEEDLNHAFADKFYRICEKYDTPYLILSDIISENPSEAEEIISQPEMLENCIRQAYNKRAKTIKSRLSRAAFYATLSIFLTDALFLFALEIPITKLIEGHFTILSIIINVFVPTLLMLFFIITIKLPPKENIDITAMEVAKIVYEGKKKDVYEIKIHRKRGFITETIITIFYVTCFALFCWAISWGLSKINLPLTSQIIFIVFISIIAFAGTKIRKRVKEIEIIERKESFLYFFVDLFAIPFIHFGKWLSSRWKRINIFSTFFTILIDMPFQVFIEFLEQWRYFLKEKKEEMH